VKAVKMETGKLWRKGFVKQMSYKSGIKDQETTDGKRVKTSK